MPARDFCHDVAKSALIADGWTITHDSLVLQVGAKDLFVDLGAERLLAADEAAQKIAVEDLGEPELDQEVQQQWHVIVALMGQFQGRVHGSSPTKPSGKTSMCRGGHGAGKIQEGKCLLQR